MMMLSMEQAQIERVHDGQGALLRRQEWICACAWPIWRFRP
jgi:hypothetical protein